MAADKWLRKIQFSFTEKTIGVLKKLKTNTGASSFAEVLRNAIAFYYFVVFSMIKGATIKFLTPEGEIKELILPLILNAKKRED